MTTAKQIESIAIDRLIAHPANPNRMSDSVFNKLTNHIKRTGNYEPIIVRSGGGDSYQIINGHHRVMALRKLGRESADCIVWQVDDAQTLLLLGTLNRLCGNDELYKKSELIQKLSKSFSVKELTSQLPDGASAIERLKDLTKLPRPLTLAKPFLNGVVFFLDDEQKAVVDEAVKKAEPANAKLTGAQKRAAAIVKIAKAFQ